MWRKILQLLKTNQCKHSWINTAVWNIHYNDFGPEGPWDGAYAKFCINCKHWEAETRWGDYEKDKTVKLVSLVDPITHEQIGNWINPKKFREYI